MPDPRSLAFLIAAALGAVAPAARAADCAPALSVVTVGEAGIELTLHAPCAPYAPVALRYGAISFAEETDTHGRLSLTLPRLAGADTVDLVQGSDRLSAPVPQPDLDAAPYTAVIWPDGTRWGHLGTPDATPAAGQRFELGFPAGGPVADILTDAAQAWLDLPVTPDTCGRAVSAQVLLDGRALPLTLTLPGCDGSGGALRVPLTAPG